METRTLITTPKLLLAFLLVLAVNHLIAQNGQPNILLVLTDDLGYNDVGFNGSTDITTPELDKLAGEGTIFTSAYVAHTFCGPSRAAIMTGRYPHMYGAQYNLPPNMTQEEITKFGVSEHETFISTVLQNSGYHTGLVGKWHLGEAERYHPNQRGFDDFYGFLAGGHDYFPEQYRKAYEEQLEAGVERIRDYILPLEHNGQNVGESEYLTDALTGEAIRFVAEAKAKEKPFFLFLSYNAPHVPLEAKQEDLEIFAHIEDIDRRTYAAMVYAVDRGVGNLVSALKTSGQYENTLIVFLSDNGGNTDHGANNYPLKGKKGDTWEGGYRIPMFMHWPNEVPGGQRFEHPVSALDLYPTFASMAGAQIPENKKLDGKNILSNINSGNAPYEGEMIYALRYRYGYIDVGARSGDWKIARVGNEPWDLFNIKNDIREHKNLKGQKPELFKEMIEKTKAWSKELKEPEWFNSEEEGRAYKVYGLPNYDETFRAF